MNRNVLIVGGSDGIGFECAKLFDADNDRVYNLSRRVCELPRVKSVRADVTDAEQLENAFRELRGAPGSLDLVLYFAGTSMAAPVETVKEEDVRLLFDVNYFGALRVVKLALPIMNRGGKFLFASSIASAFPILYDGYYSASKAALEAFCAELRLELAGSFTASCVRIGGTRTHFTFKRKVYPPEQCGRHAEPLATASGALARIEQKGMDPADVAAHFFDLAGRKNPPRVSTCGAVNKLGMVAKKFLPDRVVMAMNNKIQTKSKE